MVPNASRTWLPRSLACSLARSFPESEKPQSPKQQHRERLRKHPKELPRHYHDIGFPSDGEEGEIERQREKGYREQTFPPVFSGTSIITKIAQVPAETPHRK